MSDSVLFLFFSHVPFVDNGSIVAKVEGRVKRETPRTVAAVAAVSAGVVQ
jgi:hypothetical protein